jgi:membrane-associated phospholipid phosphatase
MKNSILCKIGNWGPLILFGTSVYLLSDKGNMLYYYMVGLILNTIFNVFLKVTIQQPRPSIDSDRFNLLLKNYNDNLFKNGIPDIFGMPSGHTQSIAFSTMYVFFSLKQRNSLFTGVNPRKPPPTADLDQPFPKVGGNKILLAFEKSDLLPFYLLISLITMWQRVYCNHHTVFQVVVGGAVGSLFAYFVYKLARSNILGILRQRPDDNALI